MARLKRTRRSGNSTRYKITCGGSVVGHGRIYKNRHGSICLDVTCHGKHDHVCGYELRSEAAEDMSDQANRCPCNSDSVRSRKRRRRRSRR
jgi:hypothetical protein